MYYKSPKTGRCFSTLCLKNLGIRLQAGDHVLFLFGDGKIAIQSGEDAIVFHPEKTGKDRSWFVVGGPLPMTSIESIMEELAQAFSVGYMEAERRLTAGWVKFQIV
ncbi:MAG: hypothetical protein COU11_00555 [Candidatus Harrisonbacteria bacterium CG10_big_fil_rev_8_21_14_0_10_49_15]|uniref:Uncharacterized protein n=1 Tax=Candidatus Harrisonbacteria bacterium CG10_big_fil_rev_8_21_14_0_10_49_15 TaxID=1974587 RepID=A0A2H0ULW2_9BACT|nr:MAG: hypothetical protein COU11_00555 [Candidatus Harrisonbacteria bacterium CG10_big_fil_rev_8_21_14_0_10_49_15]